MRHVVGERGRPDGTERLRLGEDVEERLAHPDGVGDRGHGDTAPGTAARSARGRAGAGRSPRGGSDHDVAARLDAFGGGLDPFDRVDGVVDDLPVRGRHRLERLRLARLEDLGGRPSGEGGERRSSTRPETCDVDGYPRRSLLAATPLEDGPSQLLQRVEGRATWADEQPEVVAVHLHGDGVVLHAHGGGGVEPEALDDPPHERANELRLLLDGHLPLLAPRFDTCPRGSPAATPAAPTRRSSGLVRTTRRRPARGSPLPGRRHAPLARPARPGASRPAAALSLVTRAPTALGALRPWRGRSHAGAYTSLPTPQPEQPGARLLEDDHPRIVLVDPEHVERSLERRGDRRTGRLHPLHRLPRLAGAFPLSPRVRAPLVTPTLACRGRARDGALLRRLGGPSRRPSTPVLAGLERQSREHPSEQALRPRCR